MSNEYALKSVYCAFVRSKLEYANVIWNPYYASGSNAIESIQKKFVLFALRKLGWRTDTFVLPSYLSRCQLIGLESLERRRINASIFFMYDILKNNIEAPILFNMLEFNESRRITRTSSIFKIEHRTTNYARNQPITRMCSIFNEITQLYNDFTSRNSFREHVKALASINSHGNTT